MATPSPENIMEAYIQQQRTIQELQTRLEQLSNVQQQQPVAAPPIPAATAGQQLNSSALPKKPIFNGSSKSVKNFLFLMLNYLNALVGLSEAQKVAIIIGQLEGSALVHVRRRSASTPYVNADVLLNDLKAKFTDPALAEIARRKLDKLKQTGAVVYYNERFNDLLLECSHLMSPAEIYRAYCAGLKVDVVVPLKLAKPHDLETAMHIASEVDMTIHPHRVQQHERSHHVDMELGAITHKQRDDSMRSRPTCWNCGRSGHTYVKCKAPKKTPLPFKPAARSTYTTADASESKN